MFIHLTLSSYLFASLRVYELAGVSVETTRLNLIISVSCCLYNHPKKFISNLAFRTFLYDYMELKILFLVWHVGAGQISPRGVLLSISKILV